MKAADSFSKVCRIAVCALWTLMCTLMLCLLVIEEAERPDLSVLLTLLFAGALLLCCAGIRRLQLRESVMLTAVLAVGLAARLLYIVLVPSEPMSDFAILYRAAQELAQGNPDWIHSGADSLYFSRWSYQLPFVLYEAGLLRLFGSVSALKLCNLSFMLGTELLIYKSAEKIWGSRAGACAALFYAVCPELIQMSPVLTNQHISAFFLLLGLYILLDGQSSRQLVLSGIFLGISDLMRPEGSIVLIALILCAVWNFLQSPSGQGFRTVVFSLLLVLIGFLLVGRGTELILLLSHLAPEGIGNAVPEWKFVLGLDFTGSGSYSDKNLYILDIRDAAIRRSETLEIIRSSWRSCEQRLHFFLGKIRILWLRDAGSAWTTQSGDYAVLPSLSLHRLDHYLHQLHLAVCAILWASGLFALPTLRQEDEKGHRARLFAVTLIGFFLIYLLIEVQPRYRYELMPLLAVMSAAGFSKTIRRKKA